MSFKVKKHVTLPLLKFGNNALYVKFDAPSKRGEVKPNSKYETAPLLAPVTNMETGEVGQIIVGKVLEDILKEGYPDDSHIGKIFEIKETAPEGSRKYRLYHVTEVEKVEEEKSATETVKSLAKSEPKAEKKAA